MLPEKNGTESAHQEANSEETLWTKLGHLKKEDRSKVSLLTNLPRSGEARKETNWKTPIRSPT